MGDLGPYSPGPLGAACSAGLQPFFVPHQMLNKANHARNEWLLRIACFYGITARAESHLEVAPHRHQAGERNRHSRPQMPRACTHPEATGPGKGHKPCSHTWNSSVSYPVMTSGLLNPRFLEYSSRSFSTCHLPSFVPNARNDTPKQPPSSIQPPPKKPGLAYRETHLKIPNHQHTSNALSTPVNLPRAGVACIPISALIPPAALLRGLSAASTSFSTRHHTRQPEVKPDVPLLGAGRQGAFVPIYPSGGSDLPTSVLSGLRVLPKTWKWCVSVSQHQGPSHLWLK